MKEKILSLLEEKAMTVKEISEVLHQTSALDFKALVKQLSELERKGHLIFLDSGKLSLPFKHKTLTGVYRANERGYGFVSVEGMMEDIYIPKGYQQTALSGDRVVIEIIKEADMLEKKGMEGKVLSIEQRQLTRVVGEYVRYSNHLAEKYGYTGYVLPTEKTLSDMTCFILPTGLDAVDGTICVVDITQYPTLDNPKSLEGVIVKEIGFKDAPGVDILTILHQHGIPTTFPEDVLEQAERIALTLSEDDLKGRRDLRQETIITIDGADAKDLDDAISLKILENGHFQLGVHIADVSHYVTENSPLDLEAYDRGTSVYLTDRVVPMLPQRLSNGICSLHPDEDRLTMSCVMEIDMSGRMHHYEIFPSVICSKKRMVYDTVNAAIVEGNKKAREEYAPFLPMLEQMREVHYALYHLRRRRGAIDFDTKEAKIYVDDNGAPTDIVLRTRGLAERMIESFMLVANETVAKHYMDKKYPFIYRVHEQPAEEKMQRFMEFLSAFGVTIKGTSETVDAKALQKVLSDIEDEPYEAVVSTVLLRSMKQAKYDAAPLGHFGLSTDEYTHFTSPIRRYPDLIVHRFIKKYEKEKPLKSDYDMLEQRLEDIAHQSSLMERRAVEAERDTNALKKAEYMLDKIGQEFGGVVSSVTRFGMFVELENTVEGLIHVSKMSDDHYEFIENHLLLVGTRTGKTYQIGQQVTVKVTKVDMDTHDIDFEVVLSEKEKKTAKRMTRAKKQKGKQQTKKFVKKKRK
ncbi:ribonuclease R [Granulicatella sp. zg-ZJ]|uniref:ribonuclease R n=1 Tax=Granulicatella sp. zg-ZJ TaxID=2678504 RepID=UPI00351AE333